MPIPRRTQPPTVLPSTAVPMVAVDHFEQVSGRHIRQITRLTWRGWTVHIVDDRAVHVPLQPTEGKTTPDLAACLRSAYARLSVGERCSGPDTGSRRVRHPGALADAVAAVITAAADVVAVALHRLQPTCDVYENLRRAWASLDGQAPFSAVLATVRDALDEHSTLADFSATASPEQAYQLLMRARQSLPAQSSAAAPAQTA